jgi:hemerythrin-like domain-containing protein
MQGGAQMMSNEAWSRRRVIRRAGLAAGAMLVTTAAVTGQEKKAAKGKEKEKQEEVEVAPPEDLMREHAVLERLLLICEKALASGNRPADWPMTQLADATRLVRTFIEDYHEKLEEDYIFPRFQKAGRLIDLTAVLLQQHQAGRQVTDAVISQIKQAGSLSDTQALAGSLRAFIRMYRPHAARESTILFPQIGAVVPPREYQEMGDKFEEIEHQKFGTAGFEGVVQKVAEIEKTLGLYDLASFTPKPA